MTNVDDGSDLMERLRRALGAREGLRLVLLFGSRARGSRSPESDVDLAVDAVDGDSEDLAGALSAELGVEVDVVSLDRATIPLLEALIRDGVVVHEARPGTAAAWRARTLAQLETDRPWYRRMRDAWIGHVAESGVIDGG